MHWPLRSGGRFNERVGRRDEGNHRDEVRRLVQRGEPLNATEIRTAQRADFAIAPALRRDPFDGIVAVAAIVAIGREHAVRITAPAHVHPHDGVAVLRERFEIVTCFLLR